MEPGTDRRHLVAAWLRIERRRRSGTHLAVGSALLLGGSLALLFGLALPVRLCSQGAGYAGCVTSAPGLGVRVALLAVGVACVAAGALTCRHAFAGAG